MIKQIAFLILILTASILAQPANLTYTTVTVDSLEDSIVVDLGLDLDYLGRDYESGNEFRVIGIILSGTWTNDSLQVLASTSSSGTYFPVYYNDALVYEIGTTGNSWLALQPQIYAGLRYICLKPPAAEADDRTMILVKRQY